MKCSICNSDTATFADTGHAVDYYECPSCHYIFKAPEHHMGLDEQKLRYELHENDPEDAGYRAYFQRFLDFVLPRIPQGGTALDFGSGATDLLSKMLAKAGYDTVRYDLIYHPDETYTKTKYDLIVSVEVFEHLSDSVDIMSHLSQLLLPKGHIALQTQFHPQNREEFLDWYYRLDPTHIGFFAPQTFRRIAQISDLVYIVDDNANKVILQNQ